MKQRIYSVLTPTCCSKLQSTRFHRWCFRMRLFWFWSNLCRGCWCHRLTRPFPTTVTRRRSSSNRKSQIFAPLPGFYGCSCHLRVDMFTRIKTCVQTKTRLLSQEYMLFISTNSLSYIWCMNMHTEILYSWHAYVANLWVLDLFQTARNSKYLMPPSSLLRSMALLRKLTAPTNDTWRKKDQIWTKNWLGWGDDSTQKTYSCYFLGASGGCKLSPL